MPDIVEALKLRCLNLMMGDPDWELLMRAADEIERLRTLITSVRGDIADVQDTVVRAEGAMKEAIEYLKPL